MHALQLRVIALLGALILTTAGGSAEASFHFMQIEQVIGGVNGDTSAQAIQLRMRSVGQNLVAQSRMRVFDATGSNPILLIDMTTNVVSGAGRRILIASPNFSLYSSPAAVPDFTMTNLIPPSYLAAGSLTFEDDIGTVYWRLSWGGAGYTGSHAGSFANDSDGNFGPGVSFPLPSTSLQALQFTGASNALSTNNAAQYVVTAGTAVFINNLLTSFITSPAFCDGPLGNSDADGCLTALDIQGVASCVVSGQPGTLACACADVSQDETLDTQDVDDLVTALLAEPGPCP